jgi:hypothetical protein
VKETAAHPGPVCTVVCVCCYLFFCHNRRIYCFGTLDEKTNRFFYQIQDNDYDKDIH